MNCTALQQHLSCLISQEMIHLSVTANCSSTATEWPTEDTWTNIAIGTVAVTVAVLQLLLGNRIANTITRLHARHANEGIELVGVDEV
ncbi:hypothetical protein G6011_06751 [Alternaria panax]|uniref:Transmembrane protein n=1 Tax=Alternaria panax TaxID=48097 RepID=A0AAD4I8A8_9PLEO|nr:hypothetical protein G6011_06751 [Alternaria panax]